MGQNIDKDKEAKRLAVIRILRGLGMAVVCLLLVWGLREQLRMAIDKCLVPIFGFKGNVALSLFFTAVTLVLGILLVVWYCGRGKVVSLRDAFLLLVSVGVYGIFRCGDGYYQFEGYWDSDFAYTDGFAVESLLLLVLFVVQRVRLFKQKPLELQSERFSTDLPIDSYEDDEFQLEGLVKRIVRYILQTDVSEHSFSMGVVGGWGEGKSSLMNLIRKELNGKEGYLIMDFRPRSSKDINHIQEDFLESLRRVLAPHHSGMRRTIAQYADTINVANGTPELIKWLLSLVRIGATKDVSVTRQELQDAIKDTGQSIVVFVDDLDRLTGKEILEVLKVIDRNGAFAGVYFLTAYDKNYVNAALSKELGAAGAGNYSDKYFSVEVRLPAHPSFRLLELLQELLNEAVEKNVIHNVSKDAVKETLQKNQDQILDRLKTIRDVKRFVNQLIYSFAGVQNDVVFGDYLLLELIKFCHPDEYTALHHYQYLQSGFPTDASNDLWYLSDELIPKKENGVEVQPANPPASLDILKKLFPVPAEYSSGWYNNRGNRVYSNSAFEFYFFNYEYAHLTQEQLSHLYDITLSEACAIINGWSTDEKRDLTSYLLTKDLSGFTDITKLQRYFQLTLFAYGKIGNINYWGLLFGIVRKDTVSDIMKRHSIKGKAAYLDWLKETLMPFLEIDPQTASEYLLQTIKYVINDPSNESEMFMALSDLQDIASQIAVSYLSMIDTPGWNPFLAIYMAQVPKDNESLVPVVASALRKSITQHFERYSNNFVSLSKTNDAKNAVIATYHQLFRLTKVFTKPYVFGAMIHAKQYDSAPEIDLVRSLWPLYASNGFAPVVFDSETDIDSLRNSLFADYLDYLSTFKEIGRRIVDIEREWDEGRGFLQAQRLLDLLNQYEQRLVNIPFTIKMKDDYIHWDEDVFDTISAQKEAALLLTSDKLKPGDFVTVNDTPSLERPEKYPGFDVFTVEEVLSESKVRLKEVKEPFPITDLRAIPIDAKTQDIIYYDPIVLRPGNAQASQADYTPFMERFKKVHDSKGVSYDALIEKARLNFVHEVQHWLRTRKKDLKLKHSLSPAIE